jgi:NADPH-dependent curcumin reductase CurA
MITSREIRLKSRIVGAPVADNFELATVSVPAPRTWRSAGEESLDVGRPLYARSHGRPHEL